MHRAQGLTIDTAHAVIDTNTATREVLYVAMTRGAEANHVYVASDSSADDHVPHGPARTAGARLVDALARVGAEASATDTLRLAVSEHTSLTTLIHEYETIAAHAVSIGIARWPRYDGYHRTRIAGLTTIPEGRLPADYAAALRRREQARSAVTAREPWTHGRSRTLEAMTIYRVKYGITDPEAVAVPPDRGDRAQALDYHLALRALLSKSPFAAPEGVGAPTWNGIER